MNSAEATALGLNCQSSEQVVRAYPPDWRAAALHFWRR